jgi:hypothetical protein
MGVLSDIKYKRKAVAISMGLLRKSDDSINNLLYDLRTKYSVSDDDWMTIEAATAILTQRRILESQGLGNDDLLNDGGDDNVGAA